LNVITQRFFEHESGATPHFCHFNIFASLCERFFICSDFYSNTPERSECRCAAEMLLCFGERNVVPVLLRGVSNETARQRGVFFLQ